MTTDDDWLREKARQKKHQSAHARQREEPAHADNDRRTKIFKAQIDALWGQLQVEVRRQAGVYNDEAGAEYLLVETHPDRVVITSSDGNALTLRLDRENQTVAENFVRSSGGSIISGGPIGGSFNIGEGDRLAFSEGTPTKKARAALEQLLS